MELVFNSKTDLALRALGRLHRHGERMSGAVLADEIGTSLGYLPQVLAPMVLAGWVDSERGPNGGYRLAVPLDRLSLLDIIERYEGSLSGQRCVLRGAPCPSDDTCPLHSAWGKIAEVIETEFGARSALEALGPPTKEGS